MYLVDMAKSNNPTNLRIAMLRDSFDKAGVEGYLVPVRDEYGNEFVPDCFRRLEYLTGFSGSNGLALILREHALFFTDGRYLTQSAREINLDIFEIKDQSEIKNINWTKYLSNNPAIGYNPALFTLRNIEIFKFLNLKTISQDLIDLIWSDRPEPIRFQAYEYPVEFAGQSVQKKISNLLDSMRLSECEGLLITSCESICWLLNLRGGEVAFSPIICGTLFITCQNIRLLVPYPENFKEVQTFIPNLDVLSHDRLGEILSDFDGRIGFDPNYTNLEIYDFLKLKNTKHIGDPCLLSRAIKNEIEIKHSRAVHLEDAIAMCEFLSYIDSEFQAGGLPYLTEYDLTLRLTDLRSKRRGYLMDSFPTICGFRENSAVIHYRPSKSDSKKISDEGILLIDSGGHYLGGTTDITRTLYLGTPERSHIQDYTLVLKGHIALASIKFPVNVTMGCNLDVLARSFLWNEFKDYKHGTGHGVGNCINVHEGPHALNQKNSVPLKPGMILSNEPGYYIADEYGIRIENLMYVKESQNPEYLAFENLTLVPYYRPLIDETMLSSEDKIYLNSYYNNIRKELYPLLSSGAQEYLIRMTEPF